MGCYFGGMLAHAGVPVTLIGRPKHVDAIERDGLFFDGLRFQERIPVTASTEIEAVRDAAVVLLCVKTLDTENVARALCPLLASDAVIVSMQNGVDNVSRIRAATGIEAIPAVVYVGAAMTAPGRVKHAGRGDLVIGDIWENERLRVRLDGIAAMFEKAEVPCRVSDNVEGELWIKMIVNCAYNAISALGRARYGVLASQPETREVMRKVTEEALVVALVEGVRMPDIDMVQTVMKIADAMSGATSSTALDIARGNHTEIDSLNGYLVRRGAELGVPTPVNHTLYALVKLLESANVD